MSILFTLVTFLLFITVSYYRSRQQPVVATGPLLAQRAVSPAKMIRAYGLEFPEGYSFHQGHTWAAQEAGQHVRVGLDSFAAKLLGKADKIETARPNRWVRQGQKIWTVSRNGMSVEMLAPVEGVVSEVNPAVVADPDLAIRDPYGEGWVLAIQSPDLKTNLSNLIRSALAPAWMQNSLDRLAAMTSQVVAPVAQDGGLPIQGLLSQVEPKLQRRLIREFFLT